MMGGQVNTARATATLSCSGLTRASMNLASAGLVVERNAPSVATMPVQQAVVECLSWMPGSSPSMTTYCGPAA